MTYTEETFIITKLVKHPKTSKCDDIGKLLLIIESSDFIKGVNGNN